MAAEDPDRPKRPRRKPRVGLRDLAEVMLMLGSALALLFTVLPRLHTHGCKTAVDMALMRVDQCGMIKIAIGMPDDRWAIPRVTISVIRDLADLTH